MCENPNSISMESTNESIKESYQEDQSNNSSIDSSENQSPSFSNVDQNYFLNSMKDLKYLFFHETEFESFSRIIQYDTRREKIKKTINFPSFHSSNTLQFDEKSATPFLINQLENHLELDKLNYKIIDSNCKFSIRLPNPYKRNHEITGHINAVIVPESIGEEELSSNVCVGIDFKTPNTISNQESHNQLLLRFIGALRTSTNKKLPILFVSTDLDTFKFVWLPDQGKKIIHCYETRNARYAINRIKEFIDFHHYLATNQQVLEVLKAHENFDDDNWTPEYDLIRSPSNNESVERRIKAEEAFRRYSLEGKLKTADMNFSRTKFVYKIHINNTQYIFKIANRDSMISDELRIEADIYKYLSDLKEEIGDCIPELYYAGEFLQSSYIIVTEFIEGRHPSENWTNECDVNSCSKVLRMINHAGVLHGDPKTLNFVMVAKPLKTDENGEIFVMQEKAIILDFGFSKKRFIRQEENLRFASSKMSS